MPVVQMAKVVNNSGIGVNATVPNALSDDKVDIAGLQFHERVIFVLLLSMGTVFTLFGNSALCVAVCTFKKLRRAHNAFYVNLAIADIFVLVVMTIAIVSLISDRADHTTTSSAMSIDASLSELNEKRSKCYQWLALDLMSSITVILSIAALTVNMHVHIIYPFKYEELIRKKWLIVVTIAAIWGISAIIAFVPIHYDWQASDRYRNKSRVEHFESTTEIGVCRCHFDPTYVVTIAVFSFFVPSVIICVLNFRLYHHSQYHYSNIKKTSSMCSSLNALTVNVNANAPTPTHYGNRNFMGESFNLGSSPSVNHHGVGVASKTTNANGNLYAKRSTGNLNRWLSRSQNLLAMQNVISNSTWMLAQLPTGRLKAARTLGCMTISFLICWGGFYIAMLVNSFSGSAISDRSLMIISTIAYYNSCLNPLIYTRFNHDFQESFSTLFCRRPSGDQWSFDDCNETRRRRGSVPNVAQANANVKRVSDEVPLSDVRLRRFYSCSALI